MVASMNVVLYLLFGCLIALLFWIGYMVVSGLFVWPPPIPTSLRTRRKMIEAIRLLRAPGGTFGLIMDPGCGFGGLALALARAFPDERVVGIDAQPLCLWIAQLRAKLFGVRNVSFRRGDIFHEDYTDTSVIACYLYGDVMEELSKKWAFELQDGSVVVTNLHPIPNWRSILEVPIKDWLFGARAVYAYRIPESRLCEA